MMEMLDLNVLGLATSISIEALIWFNVLEMYCSFQSTWYHNSEVLLEESFGKQ